ncbi:MAG: SDR family NAD(P)-dependent oxidoreductase, partial [Cyanobacteria bacterium P01_A01_bin.114]
WQPKQATVTVQTQSGPTLIFQDELGTGAQLSETLSQDYDYTSIKPGTHFQQVSDRCYQINPADPEDYRQLVRSVVETQGPIQQVLHLWALEPLSPAVDDNQMIPWLYSVLFLIQALEAEQNSPQSVRCLIGGNAVQSVMDGDPIVAQKAAVLGLIKTAAQEFDWLDCRHVDLPEASAVEQASWLERELLVSQFEREVVYRDGKRWVPRFEQVNWQDSSQQNVSAQQGAFKSGGFYVLSGGLGGVGVEIAQYLLETFDAKLLLLGRTALPDQQTWERYLNDADSEGATNALANRIRAYQTLIQLGDVQYEAVDLGDAHQLETVVKSLEGHWQQPMDGILHLAGVAAEQAIVDETQASFETVLYPKVVGAIALSQLLDSRPESTFISFSSVNGFFGGSRAGAYASANTFLDAFHLLLSQRHAKSFCFAWSMWDNTGMSHGYQMKEFSRIQGYYAVPQPQAIQSMLGCLHHQQSQVWIGLDSQRRNVRRYLAAPAASLKTLMAYFTSARAMSADNLAQLEVRDRFNIRSHCTYQKIADMPLTEQGDPDRAKLSGFGQQSTAESIEPRTAVEKQLVEIWQEVLGVTQIGVRDSFFELGGTSLQAAKLFAQIDEVFGKNLPLATLFTTQTVEQLAELLGDTEGKQLWSSIVTIQPEGDKPPLFCIHGAGGNILMYRQLVAHLDPDQPIYGIQPQGLNSDETPIDKLRDMADVYVQKMRELQPEGPYYILGLSIGGAIAVEMAHLLKAAGQEVSFLGMIDSLGPGYPKLLPVVPRLVSLMPYAATEFPKRAMQRIQQALKKSSLGSKAQRPSSGPAKPETASSEGVEVPPQEPGTAAAKSAKIRSLKGCLNHLSLTILRYSPWAFVVPVFYLNSGSALPDHLRKVQEANVRAFLEYNPDVYAGSATLFKAAKQPPGCYVDPQMGWGKVIDGMLTVCEIPGHHGESLLYREESLHVLGPKLKQALRNAQLNH